MPLHRSKYHFTLNVNPTVMYTLLKGHITRTVWVTYDASWRHSLVWLKGGGCIILNLAHPYKVEIRYLPGFGMSFSRIVPLPMMSYRIVIAASLYTALRKRVKWCHRSVFASTRTSASCRANHTCSQHMGLAGILRSYTILRPCILKPAHIFCIIILLLFFSPLFYVYVYEV